MQKELPSAYDPKTTESKIYELWEKSGFFNPDKLPKTHKKTFTITIPPPNVTGELHMGHALNAVIQDAIIRRKRMQGYKTLWIPGTDHAGIATQNKVEQKLKKENLSRFDLGRDKFIEEVWKWKEQYGNIILHQLKQIGASCDWSRARFTMDNGYANSVSEAFVKYYNKGWLYRALRVVNWCIRCGTSLSDLELEYKGENGKLWHIRYKLENQHLPKKTEIQNSKISEVRYIIVATTRPETMLGDAAVAVNPKDERYKDLIGKNVVLPIQNRNIPIIADYAVDPSFGTGAVKVTPLHDFNDWEIAQRHNLPQYKIINERGRMTKGAGAVCEGLKINECREKVLEELAKQNLLEKTEDFAHQVPHCYRCDSIIEPLANLQWFLKMDQLAKTAMRAVKKREVKFVPKRWDEIYIDWLKNVRDWCVSRQIWWGHRLPVWFCGKSDGFQERMDLDEDIKVGCGQIIVSGEKPRNCPSCKGTNLKQSEDVLDTWFSSALWPFATLGWPDKKSKDLKTFYPTQVLSTDRGIINLWVARMIFSSYEFTGQKPFDNVIIHATVLTKDGRRMSKSLGTGIDPLQLIDKYGADATRFGIAYQAMGGQDIRFAEEHIMAGKKFCNKLWNISRFVLLQTTKDESPMTNRIPKPKSQSDKKILSQFNKMSKLADKYLEQYQFGHAAHALYDFVWHDFADVYLEESKKQIARAETKKQAEITKTILLYILTQTLKLLHPFTPFITEEIYSTLPIKDKKLLIVESWPVKSK